MKKFLSVNDNHVLQVISSLSTPYMPKEKYIPSQKTIRSLEIAYEKKVNEKKQKSMYQNLN